MPVSVPYLSDAEVQKVEAALPATIKAKLRDRLVEGESGLAVVLEEYPSGAYQCAPVATVEARIVSRDGSGGWQRFLDKWLSEGRIT